MRRNSSKRSKYRKGRGGMSDGQLVAMGYGMGLAKKNRRRRGGVLDASSFANSKYFDAASFNKGVDKYVEEWAKRKTGSIPGSTNAFFQGARKVHEFLQKAKPLTMLSNTAIGRIPGVSNLLKFAVDKTGYGRRRGSRRKYRR